jgi:hypothetical protein
MRCASLLLENKITVYAEVIRRSSHRGDAVLGVVLFSPLLDTPPLHRLGDMVENNVTTTFSLIFGSLAVALSAVLLVAAWGLFKGNSWGWSASVIAASTMIILSFVPLVMRNFYFIAFTAAGIAVVYCLFRPSILNSFRNGASGKQQVPVAAA